MSPEEYAEIQRELEVADRHLLGALSNLNRLREQIGLRPVAAWVDGGPDAAILGAAISKHVGIQEHRCDFPCGEAVAAAYKFVAAIGARP